MVEGFSFEDILIVPKHTSKVTSRSLVNTDSVELIGKFCRQSLKLKIPLISASMSVLDTDVNGDIDIYFAKQMAFNGGLHIFSRSRHDFATRMLTANHLSIDSYLVGIAVSYKEFLEHYDKLVKAPFVISIDIANGAIIKDIPAWEGYYPLIIGNFANPNIGIRNFDAILKMGIGGGAACTTRLVTGVGYPQASLISHTVQTSNKCQIISDGGITSTADFVKAIALGADAVMVGSMFTRCVDSPGLIINKGGIEYKEYYGEASSRAKQSNNRVEGGVGLLRMNGLTVSQLIQHFKEGLESAMSYTNSFNISQFQAQASFIKSNSYHENGLRFDRE